ncbi:hypothetical protein [Stappia sp.]|uniref:hypothetical protein n=1 Tax=Stappia sp. TaxID=1870903 RepID=UPI003C7DB5C4
MKNISFILLAGGVGAIISLFLPEAFGLQKIITLIGTLSAIAGGAIALIVEKNSKYVIFLLVISSLVLAVFSLTQYNMVANGEPGPEAAKLLYIWTLLMFLPIGFLVETAGVKIIR